MTGSAPVLAARDLRKDYPIGGETVHALRTTAARQSPELALGLISFLSRANVELVDADRGHVVAGLRWTLESSARRIPDAILAATVDDVGMRPLRGVWGV